MYSIQPKLAKPRNIQRTFNFRKSQSHNNHAGDISSATKQKKSSKRKRKMRNRVLNYWTGQGSKRGKWWTPRFGGLRWPPLLGDAAKCEAKEKKERGRDALLRNGEEEIARNESVFVKVKAIVSDSIGINVKKGESVMVVESFVQIINFFNSSFWDCYTWICQWVNKWIYFGIFFVSVQWRKQRKH